MGANSDIAWTDHTFNPWWGCSKTSPACAHCYAEALAKRSGHDCFGDKPRRLFGEKHWNEPLRWAATARRDGVRERVFCLSMGDVLEVAPGLASARTRLWPLVRQTADALDWLFLTKRPERVNQVPQDVAERSWWGVTIEDQAHAEERLRALCTLPARVRFVSAEPLLGPLDLEPWLSVGDLDWMICGCESGGHARPFSLEWARSLRDQCAAYHVPFFCKQLPSNSLARPWTDLERFPVDLRVRQFPEVAT